MRIIKRGIPPQEKIHQGKCMTCKTVVEFSQAEGKVTYCQKDGNSISIKCPVCGDTIYVYI